MPANIICSLTDLEGRSLGVPLDLPQDAGPREFYLVINALFRMRRSCLTRSISTIRNSLEAWEPICCGIEASAVVAVSVEQVLQIVYQPQAVFRIKPVTRCSASIPGHSEAVLSVQFSPDSRMLASGSGDTTIRFWDIYTETPLFTCTGHKNWVLCIAWSPDGKILVSGSKDGELWEPTTGKAIGNPLIGHEKWITAVSWEPAHLQSPSRRFATASKGCEKAFPNILETIAWSTSKMILVVRNEQGHGHWVNTLALSKEYVLRTGAFDHTGKQYNSAEEMKQLVHHVHCSPDGRWVVTALFDKSLRLWEGYSGKFVATFRGHMGPVYQISWSADSRLLVSGSKDSTMKLHVLPPKILCRRLK